MNDITMKLQADKYIKTALEEDITSEDISTCSVMPEPRAGAVDLIAKQDGVIAGLYVFARVFELLNPASRTEFFVSDGDRVKKGHFLIVLHQCLDAARAEHNLLRLQKGYCSHNVLSVNYYLFNRKTFVTRFCHRI